MTEKKIYEFSNATKEFKGGFFAQKHPFKENEWLMPLNCTEIAPPKTEKRQCAVWDGQNWSLVPDYRGEIWYNKDGERKEITSLGVPDGLFETNPKPAELPQTTKVLSAYQFFQLLLTLGYTAERIKNDFADDKSKLFISDKSEREALCIQLDKNNYFKPDNWILQAIIEQDNIDKHIISDLWDWALTIQL